MKSWRGRFGALVAALALCAPGFGIASYGHASAAPTSKLQWAARFRLVSVRSAALCFPRLYAVPVVRRD